jgi:DNA-binding XRE family transcriptional regulator
MSRHASPGCACGINGAGDAFVDPICRVADPIIGELRAERKRRRLSQQELGNQLGRATYNTVWQWESGANEPTLGNLRAWAAALGYDLVLAPVTQ